MFGRKKNHQDVPDDNAPGWDALTQHLSAVLPDASESQRWGSDTLPGQDGVYGISAYHSGDFWLYLTFGLTELFEKESEDPELSGWGFELTMRVPRSGEVPPSWPSAVLGQLGGYVFANASPLAPGHRVDSGGLATDNPASNLAGVAFALDPELAEIRTPNGRVTFLTAVGVTAAELERMRSTSTAEVLEGLRHTSPLLVTDPARD